MTVIIETWCKPFKHLKFIFAFKRESECVAIIIIGVCTNGFNVFEQKMC